MNGSVHFLNNLLTNKEMAKNIESKIKLGIFVSIGIVLFTVGIYFIGERQQLFSSNIDT